jgi:hypothetical protein
MRRITLVLPLLLLSGLATAQGSPASKGKPAAAPATATGAVIDPATYKPKTKFDNTPWRFDMNQNGKRMTAEEFDAWMKARGVRVATGKPATPAATADANKP